MSLLIKMKDIVKTFNIGQPGELTVLHKCNFYVKDGEFVSVVGQSGSGKSTLMNIIGLLDSPPVASTSSVVSTFSTPNPMSSPATAASPSGSCSRTSTSSAA